MKEEINTFSECIRKAEALNSNFKIALVCPDESMARVARLAKKKGISDSIAFNMQKIQGIETHIVENPLEAVEKALELCIQGEADTLAKGLLNTNIFLRPIVKSSFKISYITHCSALEIKGFERPLIVSDATVTPFPDLEQKVEIIKNSVRCAQLFGKNIVNVAILSANELVLKEFSSGTDAAILSKMAERGQISSAIIDGPMALDSAISKEAMLKKGLSFAFDPPADVLIAPDLESAAMLVKSAVYFAQAQVAGILWGTKNPIVLTSRADTDEAKYVSLCLCKLASQK